MVQMLELESKDFKITQKIQVSCRVNSEREKQIYINA